MKLKIVIIALIAFIVLFSSVNAFDNRTGFVSYYPMTGNADDYFGRNDGDVTGATLTTDQDGNSNSAYFFDTTDGSEYIMVNDSTDFDFQDFNAFTSCFWVNVSGTGNNVFMGKGSGGNNGEAFVFDFVSGTYTRFFIRNSAGGFIGISASAITLDTWNHLCGVWDGAKIYFYINGVAEASTPAATSMQTTSYPIFIGNRAGSDGVTPIYPSKSEIDEVAFFNRSLNSTQIADIYNNGIFPAESTNITTTSPDIIPGFPLNDDDLRCNATISSSDNVLVHANWTWEVNGSHILNGSVYNLTNGTQYTITTLLSGNTSTYDTIDCEITPWSENLTGNARSSSVYIREPDINITTPNLPSDEVFITDTISCNATISSEVNTTVASYYTFWVNGVNTTSGSIGNITNNTESIIGNLSPGSFVESDEIICEASGFDGIYSSTSKNSSSITVSTASLTIYFKSIYGTQLNSVPIVYTMKNNTYTTARGFGVRKINTTNMFNSDNLFDRDVSTSATMTAVGGAGNTYFYIGIPCGIDANQTIFYKASSTGNPAVDAENPALLLYNTDTDSLDTIIIPTGAVATYNYTFNNSDCRYNGLGVIRTQSAKDVTIYEVWINHLTQPILEEIISYPYPTGTVTITVDDIDLYDKYAEASQIFTSGFDTKVTINNYLIENVDVVPTRFNTIDVQDGSPISLVLSSAKTSVAGVMTTINQGYTDGAGLITMNLYGTNRHTMTFTKTGYDVKVVENIIPNIIEPYVIQMSKNYDLNYSNIWESIFYKFYPSTSNINGSELINLSVVVLDTAGTITNMRYNVSWNDTEQGFQTSTDHSGTTLVVEFNASDKTGFVTSELYLTVGNTTIILNQKYYITNLDPKGGSMDDVYTYMRTEIEDDESNGQMYSLVLIILIMFIVGAVSVVSPIGAGIVGVIIGAIVFVPLGLLTWGQFTLAMLLCVLMMVVFKGVFG